MRASDSKDSHAECDHGKGQEEFSDMKAWNLDMLNGMIL